MFYNWKSWIWESSLDLRSRQASRPPSLFMAKQLDRASPSISPLPLTGTGHLPCDTWRKWGVHSQQAGWVWKMKNEQKRVPWSFTPILTRKQMISPCGERKGIRSDHVYLHWSILERDMEFLLPQEKAGTRATRFPLQNIILFILFKNLKKR